MVGWTGGIVPGAKTPAQLEKDVAEMEEIDTHTVRLTSKFLLIDDHKAAGKIHKDLVKVSGKATSKNSAILSDLRDGVIPEEAGEAYTSAPLLSPSSYRRVVQLEPRLRCT